MPTRDQVLAEWQEAKRNADYWVEQEQRLRSVAVGASFSSLVLGTNRLELGSGYYLTARTAYHYKLANAQGETEAALHYIETASQSGPEIVASLVKWEPRLKLKGYQALPMEYKKQIDSVLTTTPAMIELKIEAPE